MIITFHGEQCVKFQTGQKIVVCDPRSPKKGSKTAKFGADLALSTSARGSSDESFDSARYGDRDPLCIYGAGGYETEGMVVRGFPLMQDAQPTADTMYLFDFDSLSVACLGQTSERSQISAAFFEAAVDIDILVISALDENAENNIAAVQTLVATLSPAAVVYTGHETDQDGHLKDLKKSLGVGELEAKLTLKAKDLSVGSAAAHILSVS